MNRFFRKIHLWLSVPLGLIISIICLSGAALVFENEVIESLNPSLYRVERPEKSNPLKPSEIAQKVCMQMSDTIEITSIQLSADPERTCMVSIKGAGKRTLSVNPYTGEVNGWTESPPFFQTMRKLHRWLMDSPAKKGEKSTGKVVVGVTTLLMVVILITGLIIWIPRNRKALKNRLSLNCRKGIRRLLYDSHVSLGFYSTIFLLLMALTGLTWSFGWYRNMTYRLFGASVSSKTSLSNGNRSSEGEEGKKKQRTFEYTVWNKVISQLQSKYPEYASIRLETKQAQVSLPGNIRRTDTIKFNPKSGEITGLVSHNQTPKSKKMKGWIYVLHTGSWGGTITKIIYFLAALIGGILPISGYYLWWKRTSRKRKKVAPRTAGK